jgi:hypothetical protein
MDFFPPSNISEFTEHHGERFYQDIMALESGTKGSEPQVRWQTVAEK